ncbi:MAG TPA: thiolase family protein [Acidimicrobiales bacterium]|nr:thiolase family protein [Acidimicrobiales bacterium]
MGPGRASGAGGRPSRAARPVVVEALRTPYGLRGGSLGGWHPVDLSAELLNVLLERAGLQSSAVDGVVLGCTSQVGAQACNIARRSVLAAGWPEEVPGSVVDSHAASSAQAIFWAAQAVEAGAQEVVVAGGVEVMSVVPLGAPLAQPAIGKPYGARLTARYKGAAGLLPPGLVAEEVARRWRLTRAQLDEWANESAARALRAEAQPPGFITPVRQERLVLPSPAEQVPVKAKRRPRVPALLSTDEAVALGRKRDIAKLRPAYLPGGLVTAANMAAEGDGAAGVVVTSLAAARRLGLRPKAELLAFASGGASPEVWPIAAVPATFSALQKAGLAVTDVDHWFVYESSAAGLLAWACETGVKLSDVNANGGALATAAPVGAIGAGLFAEAVARLGESRNGTAVVCAAGEGGVASACVLSSLG